MDLSALKPDMFQSLIQSNPSFLIDKIRESVTRGVPKKQFVMYLKFKGLTQNIIDDAYKAYYDTLPPPPPTPPPNNNANTVTIPDIPVSYDDSDDDDDDDVLYQDYTPGGPIVNDTNNNNNNINNNNNNDNNDGNDDDNDDDNEDSEIEVKTVVYNSDAASTPEPNTDNGTSMFI